jgi:integrase
MGGVMAKTRIPTNPDEVTFPLTVSNGSISFRIYHSVIREKVYYTLAYRQDGLRKREVLKDFVEVRTRADEILKHLGSSNAAVLELTAADSAAYRRARELLDPLKVPIETAAARYAEMHIAMGGVPLMKAVEAYFRLYPRNMNPKFVREVMEELFTAKKGSGLSAGYLRHLRYDLEKFASAFNTHIAVVSGGDIDTWLREMGVAPRTRNNLRNSIQTLFNFAKARKYLTRDNEEMEAVTLAKDGDGTIEIFTAVEFEEILAHAKRELTPFLALGAFAGIRHAEIQRLHWEDIDTEADLIEIKAAKAKTASRRTIPLLPNLRALLESHKESSGRVCVHLNMADEIADLVRAINQARRAAWAKKKGVEEAELKKTEIRAKELIKKARAENPKKRGTIPPGAETAELEGWKAFAWKHNGLRHSFISYRVALTQNVAQVALEAGNSPQMIFKHYRELVRPAAAVAWFCVGLSEKERAKFVASQVKAA